MFGHIMITLGFIYDQLNMLNSLPDNFPLTFLNAKHPWLSEDMKNTDSKWWVFHFHTGSLERNWISEIAGLRYIHGSFGTYLGRIAKVLSLHLQQMQLMEEILHHVQNLVNHGAKLPNNWCRMSSINSTCTSLLFRKVL